MIPTVLPSEPRPATGEKAERLAREQSATQERAAQAENANKETGRPPKVGDAPHAHGSR